MPKVSKNASGFYESKIGGHTYEFTKWGSRKALEVLTDLMSILGEPLADIIANFTVHGKKADISEGQIATTVRMLFAALRTDKDRVLDVLEDLIGGHGVLVDGKEFPKHVTFDNHYTDFGHMFEVVPAALEVQYGSFFAGLGTNGGLGLLRELARRPSPAAPKPGETPTA